MALTVQTIKKFIRIRNNSPFGSNLQFQIDARSAGFSVDELPKAERTPEGFRWDLPFGTLYEELGMLRLEA